MTVFCFIPKPHKVSQKHLYIIYPLFILVGSLILLSHAQNVNAAQVTLAWTPNIEPDLAGYNLYIGTSSGDYSQIVDVGNSTDYTVYNLTDGLAYYFAVTAYDFEGYESEYSSEVSTAFINVISRNGFEVIPSGSMYTTYWLSPPEAVNFDLQYSINNGTIWNTIATKVPDTSYNWIVPKPLKNKKNCLVEVIGYNASGVRVGEGISGGAFTIEVIKVTAPNGQETWKAGTTHAITWTTNGTKRPVTKVELFYSYDGGTNWMIIYSFLNSNPGTYAWRVPVTSSARCKVKVILKDASGITVGRDVSDKVFTIQP